MRWTAPSAATAPRAKAACAARGQCWTTAVAAGCAPRGWARPATARCRPWTASSAARGSGVSFTVRRMTLVTSSVSAKTAPMAPSGWNAGRPATVSQAYVTE